MHKQLRSEVSRLVWNEQGDNRSFQVEPERAAARELEAAVSDAVDVEGAVRFDLAPEAVRVRLWVFDPEEYERRMAFAALARAKYEAEAEWRMGY